MFILIANPNAGGPSGAGRPGALVQPGGNGNGGGAQVDLGGIFTDFTNSIQQLGGVRDVGGGGGGNEVQQIEQQIKTLEGLRGAQVNMRDAAKAAKEKYSGRATDRATQAGKLKDDGNSKVDKGKTDKDTHTNARDDKQKELNTKAPDIAKKTAEVNGFQGQISEQNGVIAEAKPDLSAMKQVTETLPDGSTVAKWVPDEEKRAAAKAKIDAAEAKIKEFETKIRELNDQIAAEESEHQQLISEISELNSKIGEAEKTINEGQGILGQAEELNKGAESDKNMAKAAEGHEKQADAGIKNTDGQLGFLKNLLNAAKQRQQQQAQRNQNGAGPGGLGGPSPTQRNAGAQGGGPGAGGGGQGGGQNAGAAQGFLMEAIGYLNQIVILFASTKMVNAIVQYAKNVTGGKLAEAAKVATEAGMALEGVGQTAIGHQLRITDAMANTQKGLSEANATYWKDAAKRDFIEGNKETQELAKP